MRSRLPLLLLLVMLPLLSDSLGLGAFGRASGRRTGEASSWGGENGPGSASRASSQPSGGSLLKGVVTSRSGMTGAPPSEPRRSGHPAASIFSPSEGERSRWPTIR